MSETKRLDAFAPDFVVFSDDWGEHPSSCQHIFKCVAEKHRVLWVNTIGMRNPTLTLTDLRKAYIKVRKMLRFRGQRSSQGTEPVGHLSVCQPMMLPFGEVPLVRRFNAWSVTRRVRAAIRTMNLHDPIIVSTVPNAADYREILDGRRVAYYCVDDFSLWPGLDSKRVSDMERRLVEQSGIIVAVSDALAEKFAGTGKKIDVLTHGVDLKHFQASENSEHATVRNIPEPRVGFFGLIDGRFDGNLVGELAERMPDVSFVFAGPTDASAGELPHRENLHFIGALPYAQLPSFVAGMRTLILPYKVDGLAEMLSPLKLKEYLATRKPVVSAPIAAARDWVGSLLVARSPTDWESALRGIVDRNSAERPTEVNERLAAESWHGKANELLALCQCVKPTSSASAVRDAAMAP